ncbi:hypothetical protein [Xanthomonas phage RTH11]|nr:hypothetical protein [Xanthomonas phage RTH11]
MTVIILYLSDWDNFPTAIADFKTTNKSFLRLAQVYEKMGVRNNAFHLSLLNPDLQGVNPFADDLTIEQKIAIGFECAQNPWYFFREVVRVPPQSGPNPVQLRANRGNIALFWSFFNHIDVALIQPRQTGKSVSTDCLMTNITYMSTDNTTVTMITKDNDLRRKNVERLKKIRDLLPNYLISISSDDADNQIELTYKIRKNSYMTAVAQNNEAGANNVGRGLTSPILHSDEGPFTSWIQVILPAALAAGTAARNEARANGRPYGNIFTTTAGKKDTKEGKFMYDMIFGGATWDERLAFDSANEKELRERVLANCMGVPGQKGAKRALFNITLSHKQLGETDEWLMDAISNVAGATPDMIERDFLNRWTAGSLRSPLSTELNERIKGSERNANYMEFSTDNYCLNWYIPEHEVARRMAEGRFVAGLDTSEAVGRDTIALVVVDVEDLSVVATGTYNETNLIRFSHYLGSLLIKYPTITLIPERKSTGGMIVDYLILQLIKAGQDPFKRIFNRIVEEAQIKKEDYQELQRPLAVRTDNFYDTRKASFGFVTNADNRTLLYTTILQQAAKNGGAVVHSERLSTEIRSLVVKNDRIDHSSSGHDDHVIAWLLAHWMLTQGRNLSHYGIDHSRVMSGVAHFAEREETPGEVYAREQQNRLLREASDLLDGLSRERDPWVLAKLEGRLRSLSGRLVDDGDTSYVQTIDAAINESRDNREKLKRLQSRGGSQVGGYRPMDRAVTYGNYAPQGGPGHLFSWA